MRTKIQNDLKDLYKRLNLYNVNDKQIEALINVCSNSYLCWKHKTRFIPDERKIQSIYLPWIGSKYKELQLLVIGINFNNTGGWDEATSLVSYAIRQLDEGKKRHFINKKTGYKGSLFYHRMACYAMLLAKSFANAQIDWQKDNKPPTKSISKSFEYIAYTNHIKCSPISPMRKESQRSKPSNEMWNNCGKYILREEIKIINPKYIIMLGKSDNWKFFKENILDSVTKIGTIGVGRSSVNNYYGYIDNNKINIYLLPHPSFAASYKIVSNLKKIIQ